MGAVRRASEGKFAYIYHFTRIVGDKREKLKKKKRAFGILIDRDVFVALAVVVARHPIFMKVTVRSILVLLQAAKYPDKLDKLFILQNFANLQGVGFKINRDLTKSAPFQFGFTCYICLI